MLLLYCICFTLKCSKIHTIPSYNITIFKILLMHWMITGILFVVFCKRFSSKRRNIKIQLGSQVPVQMITHVFGSRGNFYFSTRKILKDIPFCLPLVHSAEHFVFRDRIHISTHLLSCCCCCRGRVDQGWNIEPPLLKTFLWIFVVNVNLKHNVRWKTMRATQNLFNI